MMMCLRGDGVWRLPPLPFTDAEIATLETATPEEREEILARHRVDAPPKDAAIAQATYDMNRIEGAELIGCDVTLPACTGIINCRVDGEHVQIRF
jgi:hypothetical protein